MKDLILTLRGELVSATIINGTKSDYVKLVIQQGLKRLYTFTRDMTLADKFAGTYDFTVKVNEFKEKVSFEITFMELVK